MLKKLIQYNIKSDKHSIMYLNDDNLTILFISTSSYYEITRDKFGHILTFKNNTGYNYEYIRDEKGNALFYINPLGNKFKIEGKVFKNI